MRRPVGKARASKAMCPSVDIIPYHERKCVGSVLHDGLGIIPYHEHKCVGSVLHDGLGRGAYTSIPTDTRAPACCDGYGVTRQQVGSARPHLRDSRPVPRVAVPDRNVDMQVWTYLTPAVRVDTPGVQNENKPVIFLGKEVYLKHNGP